MGLMVSFSLPTKGWAVIWGSPVDKKVETETSLFEIGLVNKRLRKGLSLISS